RPVSVPRSLPSRRRPRWERVGYQAELAEGGGWHSVGQDLLVVELVQVRRERDARQRAHRLRHVRPDPVEQLAFAAQTLAERIHQRMLTVETMVDVLFELADGIPHDRALTGT